MGAYNAIKASKGLDTALDALARTPVFLEHAVADHVVTMEKGWGLQRLLTK